MRELTYENMMELIVRSLCRMEEYLSGHGERVAYRVMLAAKRDGRFSDEEICKLIWMVLLHDIGNYHHLHISDLMERETRTAGSHSRFGYLFLKMFGPYPDYAPVILYHHSSRKTIEASSMSAPLKWLAHSLMAADSIDLYRVSHPDAGQKDVLRFIDNLSDERFEPSALALLRACESDIPDSLEDVHDGLLRQLSRLQISEHEQQALLQVLISSIDFRSRATSLHCAIIVEVSDLLARLCGASAEEQREIHIGAALHDIGKIAIPVSILENPGKLIGEDWDIMKSHIVITEEILDGIIDDTVKNIAVRHHETLDGTGYPRGLTAKDLTLPQRILAVADVVSALSEERSYKASFPLEDVIRILDSMCAKGKLDADIVAVLKDNKESVYEKARQTGRQAREYYELIQTELGLDRYDI